MNKVLETLILKWIQKIGNENGITTNMARAMDILYEWRDKGVEFHSPNKRDKSFKVRVGVPKIRARTAMTLQSHSLVFGLWEPSRIRITPDRNSNFQNWYDFREKLVMGLGNDTWEQTHLYNLPLSMHPHISPDGQPCLGEFGAPWAGAVADSNIPVLVNVAQSFLNNWTRADCYWDINSYHRQWHDEGQHHHGIPLFKDYYAIRKLTEAINYDHNNRRNTGNQYHQFTDWYDKHKNELAGLKMDWETSYMAFIGYNKSVIQENDTSNGDVQILKLFSDKMSRIYRLISNKALEEGDANLKIGVYPILEELMCGVSRNRGVFSPAEIVFTIPPILEDITYRINNFSHPRITVPLMNVIKSKSNICKTELGDRIPQMKVFMTDVQLNQILGKYVERSLIASRPFRTSIYRLLNFFRTLQFYGDKETTQTSVMPFDPKQMMANWLEIQGSSELTVNKREVYGEQLRSIMMQIHRALLPFTVTDIVVLKYFDKIYCEVMRRLLKDITALFKGVTNEHNKRRAHTYGKSTEQDSGENQLSIETF